MGNLVSEIRALLSKELILEWRQRYAINGLLLYVVSTVFVCYLSFNLAVGRLEVVTWNTLFWIIILFSAINGISKSFMQEREERYLFYYTIASPEAVILSKIIYNVLLMLAIGLIGFAFYAFVMGNPVQDMLLFLMNIMFGAIGFASTLTMISGIAAKAKNSSTLMAVLGFPIIMPMILMLIKISKNAIDGLQRSASYEELATIGGINLIVLALSYLLFPYLWRS